MADAKERCEWNRAMAIMSNARLCFDNQDKVRILDLVPEHYHPKKHEVELTEGEAVSQNRQGWTALAAFFMSER